jgi:hypothetical protein
MADGTVVLPTDAASLMEHATVSVIVTPLCRDDNFVGCYLSGDALY